VNNQKVFSWQGWLGLSMVIVFWYINWFLPDLRTHWAFFPLWLGYILLIDGLISWRTGSSPFRRSFWRWLGYFILSAPVWWIFEWINVRVGYWEYVPIENFSEAAYVFYCTINFSVVIPAVFTTAELLSSFMSKRAFQKGVRIGGKPGMSIFLFLLGCLMLFISITWPSIGTPLIWISLFLIIDPLNRWLGYRALLNETSVGNWRSIMLLFASTLLCGFFWELWNFHSLPKWIYHIPYIDFWYIFEMPLIGYLGYLPFGLELYAMYHLLVGVLGGIPHIKI